MDKASGTVLDFFNTVEDPRQRGKVLYRLDEIELRVSASRSRCRNLVGLNAGTSRLPGSYGIFSWPLRYRGLDCRSKQPGLAAGRGRSSHLDRVF